MGDLYTLNVLDLKTFKTSLFLLYVTYIIDSFF